MDKRKRIIVSLMCGAIAILSAISILIVLTDKSHNVVSADATQPKVIFNENLELNIDVLSTDDDLNKVPFFINEEKSKYDSIESINYSQKKAGEFVGTVKANLGGSIREFYFKYSVKDTQGPLITLLEPVIAPFGTPYNLNDYIVVTDNSLASDQKLEFTVEGEIDWYTSGVYTVTIVAVDDSGNESRLEIQVIVEEEYIEYVAPYVDEDQSDDGGWVDTNDEIPYVPPVEDNPGETPVDPTPVDPNPDE